MKYLNGHTDLQLLYKEDEIITGCIRNDRIFQKALYDKYCNAMFTAAYRILSNYELANDALQEAFIQIFRDIKSFRGESKLGAWIKTIVIRTAIRLLKKDSLFVPLNEYVLDRDIQIPNFMGGEYLEKAILSLPNGFRTVFLLIEVEGYSHKEVAEMLDISEGTSKSQLYHAKQRLQKIIND